MNRAGAAAGAVVLAVGIALLVAASRFPFFLQGVPGPGFLPLFVAFGIVGSGLVLLVSAWRGGSQRAKPIQWAPPAGWARVGLMLVADLRLARYGEAEQMVLEIAAQRLSPMLGRMARQWSTTTGASPQVARVAASTLAWP